MSYRLRPRDEVLLDISEISEAIRAGSKKLVFHSGGTRREQEYHSLNDMVSFRRGLYAELALIDGQSPITLAAT